MPGMGLASTISPQRRAPSRFRVNRLPSRRGGARPQPQGWRRSGGPNRRLGRARAAHSPPRPAAWSVRAAGYGVDHQCRLKSPPASDWAGWCCPGAHRFHQPWRWRRLLSSTAARTGAPDRPTRPGFRDPSIGRARRMARPGVGRRPTNSGSYGPGTAPPPPAGRCPGRRRAGRSRSRTQPSARASHYRPAWPFRPPRTAPRTRCGRCRRRCPEAPRDAGRALADHDLGRRPEIGNGTAFAQELGIAGRLHGAQAARPRLAPAPATGPLAWSRAASCCGRPQVAAAPPVAGGRTFRAA